VPTAVIDLLVDEPFLRRSLATFLTRGGYRVEAAATAAEAGDANGEVDPEPASM
jgi:DNA-binding response OmpR family regulator